jgi:hypothetical protein
MADDKKREPDDRKPRAEAEDQLSPARALRETVGQGSQRIGNNEPIANPRVSFPEGPKDTKPERLEDDGEC